MEKKIALLAMCAVFSGCYINRAIIDPFSMAPKDPSHYWQSDKQVKQMRCLVKPLKKETLAEGEELSLDKAIDIALRNSPETQISWAQARQAAATYAETQSNALPSLS